MRCLGCEVGPVASRSTSLVIARGVFGRRKRGGKKEGTRPRSGKRQCRMVVSKGGWVTMGRSVCCWRVKRRCSCAGLLPPLAAEILEDWVPLRCSAAGFGIGEEPQARCVQGRKTKKAKLSPVTERTGVRGPGGYTGTHGPYSAGRGLEQKQCAAPCVRCHWGRGPKSGGHSNKHDPLISAWSAIVHSDTGHGLGSVCSSADRLPSWSIPLRISGFLQNM